MKRLPMRKIRDVIRLSAEGLSTRQMAASLAIGRTTLQGYLERAQEAGLSWPLPPEMSDADLERLLYPRTAREAARRAFQPDWAYVHRELRRKGVTLRLLWEEYRADNPEGCTPYSAANCDTVRSPFTVSSATRALNPASWFLRFFMF